MWYGCNRVAPSIAAGRRAPQQAGSKGGGAAPARGSHRTPARSPAGSGGSGAQLVSHAGQVARGRRRLRRAARIARRRGHQRAAAGLARGSHRPQAGSPAGSGGSGARCPGGGSRRSGAALAGWLPQITHARYGGHSNNSSGVSMSKGVALGCLSSVLALVGGGNQPRCATDGQVDPPGGAGAGGALLRTPRAARPLAASKVRALPSHRQAGNSGGGAGGAAARRGRGAAGGRWSVGTVACK